MDLMLVIVVKGVPNCVKFFPNGDRKFLSKNVGLKLVGISTQWTHPTTFRSVITEKREKK